MIAIADLAVQILLGRFVPRPISCRRRLLCAMGEWQQSQPPCSIHQRAHAARKSNGLVRLILSIRCNQHKRPLLPQVWLILKLQFTSRNTAVMVTLFAGLLRSDYYFDQLGNAIHEISTDCRRAVAKNFSAHISRSLRSAFSPSWLIACFAATRYSGLATLGRADLYGED